MNSDCFSSVWDNNHIPSFLCYLHACRALSQEKKIVERCYLHNVVTFRNKQYLRATDKTYFVTITGFSVKPLH